MDATWNNIMWYILSVTCERSVFFAGFTGFLHQWNLPPRYNWNTVESGVKQNKPSQPCNLMDTKENNFNVCLTLFQCGIILKFRGLSTSSCRGQHALKVNLFWILSNFISECSSTRREIIYSRITVDVINI
jgi:hypothetical protein